MRFALTFATIALLALGCSKKAPATDPATANTTKAPQAKSATTPNDDLGLQNGEEITAGREEGAGVPPEASGGASSTGSNSLNLDRIHFGYDDATLTSEARDILKNNAAYLNKNKNIAVVIEGHCDKRGTNEYNIALGQRRAMSVKNYLIDLGILDARISVISKGEEEPVEETDSETAYSQNRRGEFRIQVP